MLVFVDTSGFKALYDQRDDFHSRAVEWMKNLAGKKTGVSGLVTTDYVLDETATLIQLAHSHGKAVEFLDAAAASRILKVVNVDDALFSASAQLFRRMSDKRWSFTDCTSFSLMRDLGISDSFTFDRNFDEAGFRRLPPP